MRVLAWIMTGLNLLFALNTLFNAIDRNSKYSLGMTWFAGLLFLALGGSGVYALLHQVPAKHALLISVAPWLLFIVVMVLQLSLGNWQ